MAVRTLTINPNYTDAATSTIYFDTLTGRYYSDQACTSPIWSVPPPRRDQYKFLGFFSTSSSTGGNQWTDTSGNFTELALTYSWSGNSTWYGRWQRASYKCTINVNATDAQARIAEVFRSVSGNGVFSDDLCESDPLTHLDLPTRNGYSCKGLYTGSSAGTQLVDADGNVLPAFNTLAVTSDRSVYAQWMTNYKISLNSHGGIGGNDAIWYDRNSLRFTSDAASTNVVTAIEPPTRNGYDFAGYWTAETGGTKYIYSSGRINTAYVPTAAATLHAQWTAIQPGATHTLSFNLSGGTGTADPMTVQVGVRIGTLPVVTRENYQFMGWYVNGFPISATSIWELDEDAVAVARWERSTGIGAVIDYFSLGSASLVPVSSDAGDNRKRICCSHIGKYEPGVGDTSGIWRNPTVTYKVIANTTINLTLGRAFSGGSSNVSGYMIIAADVKTKIGEFPLVTVSAVANEGRDAINLFNVSIPVQGCAHAQNLLSAVNGGGILQTCTMSAKCEPVVIAENMMPCASDVVKGRLTVKAETIARGSEAAPTAGNGFTAVGEPKQCEESNIPGYSFTAQKEL